MKAISTHKELALGRWSELPFLEQLANIGSEVSRAQNWHGKDEKIFWNTVSRALELFDLTISDPRWRGRLQEIGRTKEVFCDAVLGGTEYKSSLSDLDRYFSYFAFAARRSY